MTIEQHVLVPDEQIERLLQKWASVKAEQTSLAAQEENVWKELNALLDQAFGEQTSVTFVTKLADIDPARAGRTYQMRGGGTDFNRVGMLVKERLGQEVYERFFTEQRTTVIHPNTSAIEAAAALEPALAAIVTECTTEGKPTLTRVPPAKASKDLIEAAVPMPTRIHSQRETA